MEYLKRDCKSIHGSTCSYCSSNTWTGTPTSRIPQPVPDKNNPGHYLPLENTPLKIVMEQQELLMTGNPVWRSQKQPRT